MSKKITRRQMIGAAVGVVIVGGAAYYLGVAPNSLTTSKTTGMTTAVPSTSVTPVMKVLAAAVPYDINELDPQLQDGDTSFTAQTMQYDGLCTLKTDKIPYTQGGSDFYEVYSKAENAAGIPAIAESWEWSADRLSITFKIKKGVKFTDDGTELTANDAKFMLDRTMLFIRTNAYAFIRSTLNLTGENQVTVVDANTLRVSFPKPPPDILVFGFMNMPPQGIANSKAVKTAATTDDPWGYTFLHKSVHGSGAYYLDFDKTKPGTTWVFKPNLNYWRGKPAFDQVVFNIVPDATERAMLLKRGAVDVAMGLSPKDVKTLLEPDPNIKVSKVVGHSYQFLALSSKFPPFDNVYLRRAVAYCCPVDTIVREIFQSYAVPVYSHVHPGLVGTIDVRKEGGDVGVYDLDKAKEMLKQGGKPDGFDFTGYLQTGVATDNDMMVWYQAELKKVGINMKLQTLAANDWSDKRFKGDLPTFVFTGKPWLPDAYFSLSVFFASDGTIAKWYNYSNKRIDEIVQQGFYMNDQVKRNELAKEAQMILANDMPCVPICSPQFIYPVRTNIHGYAYFPDERIRIARLTKD